MMFHVGFEENLHSCEDNLRTLTEALHMLNSKRDSIQRLFVTAHRLGQSLNTDSSVQQESRKYYALQAPEGFQLSTLEKFKEVRSTKFPKLNVFHFVVALVSYRDSSELFSAEDASLLQQASKLKTHKVYSDCVHLLHGLYAVQRIGETGQYTRPSTAEAVTIERRK